METQDNASSSSSVSGCFAPVTHFLLELLSKVRDLFRGRGNRSSTVQPAENAQTTMALPVGEEATKSGFVLVSTKDELAEASTLELISAKARDQHFSDEEEEEDDCPICLEDYDPENPKITTRCSHHFHLGCIYEWKERSDRCPVCYRVMVFEEAA